MALLDQNIANLGLRMTAYLQKWWFVLGLRDYYQFIFLKTKFASLNLHVVVILTINFQLRQTTFFSFSVVYNNINWLSRRTIWL